MHLPPRLSRFMAVRRITAGSKVSGFGLGLPRRFFHFPCIPAPMFRKWTSAYLTALFALITTARRNVTARLLPERYMEIREHLPLPTLLKIIRFMIRPWRPGILLP